MSNSLSHSVVREVVPVEFLIQPFDARLASATEIDRYLRFTALRNAEFWPGEPQLSDAELVQHMHRDFPLIEVLRFVALVDDEVVGHLMMDVRREGTEEYALRAPFIFVGAFVLKAFQGRGLGTALARTCLAYMDEHAKTSVTVVTGFAEGVHFLERLGAKQTQQAVENRAPVSGLNWPELRTWLNDPPLEKLGLHWEIYPERVPLARLEALMEPFTVLVNESPLGTTEQPPVRFEYEGHRSWYQEMDRRGGEHVVILLKSGCDIAAVSSGEWDPRFPLRFDQYLTGVMKPWRGQDLGKCVKAKLLFLLQERHLEIEYVRTFNANANAPMLYINNRLGFTVHRQTYTYQIEREALRARLDLACSDDVVSPAVSSST
jgi:GNAT superfamily N-acetyltransferase